jgi:hypothetical protein
MTGDVPEESEVFQFILDRIDSVPHLEALLLLWNSRPTKWSSKELVARLYVETEVARKLLVDLSRGQALVASSGPPDQYWYESRFPETDRLVAAVDAIYRTQIVRVSTMIHSKASSAVRDFARAFRFTKERE